MLDHVKLVYALTALHNFIYQVSTEQERDLGVDEEQEEEEDNEVLEQYDVTATSLQMDIKRDAIATEMWASYVAYNSRSR